MYQNKLVQYIVFSSHLITQIYSPHEGVVVLDCFWDVDFFGLPFTLHLTVASRSSLSLLFDSEADSSLTQSGMAGGG